MKLTQKIALGYIRAKLNLLAAVSPRFAARQAFALFCTPQFRHNKPLPAVFSAGIEHKVSFSGETVTGFQWNKGEGKKILIVHGFESSSANFETYISTLIGQGYEVLAFDAPAHGRSSGTKINALIYKDLIKQIHADFGPFNGAIAHSFGGLAISVALAEIPHGSDYRLALVAPATETTSAINHFFSLVGLNRKLRPLFDEIIMEISGKSTSWFSVNRAIKEMKASVLWVHDTDDEITPYKDAALVEKENYHNVRFVTTSGLGHRKIYRDVSTARMILDFLTISTEIPA